MAGKKLGFGKFARSIETQKQYMERKNQSRIRNQLTGACNRYPKYPSSMDYRPENSLYGLQGVGKYYILTSEIEKIRKIRRTSVLILFLFTLITF